MKIKKEFKLGLLLITLISVTIMTSGCSVKVDKAKEETVSNFETPIKAYFEGKEKGDLEIYERAYPDFYIDEMNISENAMKETKRRMENQYGENFKITYEITKEKDIEGDYLSTVQEYIKLKYKENIKVSEGKELKIKQIIKGTKGEANPSITLRVYKMNDEWKVYDISLPSMESYVRNNK